ncbi:tetratricopeptide repeat protein [Myxococcus stipitatus]|uniref:tetratricopeptide repeat protein n=1 Tax=Myxococcus stipitatus TaxID=83455 RepID=UPI001F2C86D2|nr:tetratricopeptide repeat protein [Myxococcus stipitatus]MCE9666819.1 tetratricopeptide repeat protein [Myxococcus stipitatus]
MVVMRSFLIVLTSALLLGAAEPSEAARRAFARGEAALAVGRLDAAATEYRDALSLAPGYAPALNGLGSVLFRKGESKEAIARFLEATESDPNFKMAFFNLGYAARRTSDFATAARAYERYVQLQPEDADGYYGLAESYRQLGDNARAVAAYNGYIAREKRPSEQVWVQRAREHVKALGGDTLRLGVAPAQGASPATKVAEGATVSTGGASTKGTEPEAGGATVNGNAPAGSTDASRTKGLVAETNAPALAGAAELAQGKGATSEARLVPTSATPDAQIASGSGVSHGADGVLPFPSTRVASQAADAERSSNPALAAARIRDGDLLMKERRYREAAFAFLDASHADPVHVEALFKLGNALAVLGYYSQSIAKWEDAARLTQDAAIRQSAQDNIARARVKLAQSGGSPQAAGQPPGSGPVADTTRAQARRAYEEGVKRIGSKDFPGALTHLTQAIQLEPMLAVAYTARGSANIGLRRYAEAAADYQFSLELEPGAASPLYGLAESYRALGRNAEARILYERYAASTAADVRSQLQEESRQKASKLR